MDLSKTTPISPSMAALRSRAIILQIASHMGLELRESMQLALLNKMWLSMVKEASVTGSFMPLTDLLLLATRLGAHNTT